MFLINFLGSSGKCRSHFSIVDFCISQPEDLRAGQPLGKFIGFRKTCLKKRFLFWSSYCAHKVVLGRFSWQHLQRWETLQERGAQIIKLFPLSQEPYLIFVILYTLAMWGLKILHSKVRKFGTTTFLQHDIMLKKYFLYAPLYSVSKITYFI